jgi:hypothetical protein
MKETKQKLIIYRFISDENSHLLQEINIHIPDYIKNNELKKILRKYNILPQSAHLGISA